MKKVLSAVMCSVWLCSGSSVWAMGDKPSASEIPPQKEVSVAAPELKEKCAALSTPEKPYYYGEGTILSFGEIPSVSDSPIRRDRPNPYGGSILLTGKEKVLLSIPGKWADADAPLLQLKLAPLPISVVAGNIYGLCYYEFPKKVEEKTLIIVDHPETLRLIKEKGVK